MNKNNDKPVYQSNPFFVAVEGLDLLFKKALPVAIFLAVIIPAGLFVFIMGGVGLLAYASTTGR